MPSKEVSGSFGRSRVALSAPYSLRPAGTTVACLLIGVCFAAPTLADESRLYLGAAIGAAEHAKNAALKPSADVPLMTGGVNSRDTSWNAALGYQVNSNIAFELGYRHLGDIEASVADLRSSSGAQAHYTLATEGVTLAMLGRFPIGKWTPYIRAGVLFSETELQYSGSVSGTTFGKRIKDSSEGAFFGAGLRFDIGSRWALQADFTHVMNAAEPRFGQSDYHDVSAGVMWKF